ncbi:uncharacterized protein LOC114480816 [Gouania willdenowi]|uniref:uncharacterized protein LOC114480816 n=1 Tax=Gouania willdenowi TaxID=441366 RepID=UPI0010562E99|nr:uncharacterized protein LOC114480816 [Gouania willdenowi]
MFSKFPISRLAVFALICSAVMSFIMCSDAARARPMAAQKHKGVRQVFRRRWISPYNSHPPSPVGLHAPKTGRQIETGIKTETRGGFRPTPLIIERPQNTPRFVKGNVRFNRHSPRNGKYRLGMHKVQRGHGNGNVKRPVNNAFMRQAQQTERYEKWLSKNIGHTHSQKNPQNGDLFEVHRKNTQKKAPYPFKQRSKSHTGGVGHKGALVRVNGNNAAQKSSGFPSQTGGYWNAVMSPPVGNRGVYNKANDYLAPRWITGGIQSSKFHKVSNHPTPRVASLANNFVSSVIKRDPNPKRVAPSIRDFFKPRGSVSGSDALKNKKVKSYQIQDAHTLLATITARLRPNLGLDIKPSPTPESKTSEKKQILSKAISLMNTPFSSSMRSKHVKRKHSKGKGNNSGELPKHPARIKPVTYTDNLGSVSFSAARAINHTPNVSANGEYLPTLTAEAKQPWADHWVLNSDDSVNRNSRPEPNAGEHKVVIPAEKKEHRKNKEGVDETKLLQIFFDKEESGSGSFNLPDSGQKTTRQS